MEMYSNNHITNNIYKSGIKYPNFSYTVKLMVLFK